MIEKRDHQPTLRPARGLWAVVPVSAQAAQIRPQQLRHAMHGASAFLGCARPGPRLAESLERPLPVLDLTGVQSDGAFKRAHALLLRLILAGDDALDQGSRLAVRRRLWRRHSFGMAAVLA
jgi:hypothetical protein